MERAGKDDGPQGPLSSADQPTDQFAVNLGHGQDYGSHGAQLLLEQYKIYVESASKVSDRRGAANSFLMTANTGLITAYALIAGKDAALGIVKGSWSWLAPLVGVTICVAWFSLIQAYRALNSAKFKVIHELEQHLPAQLYDREWRHLKDNGSLFMRLTHVEQAVPIIFALIYVGLAIGGSRYS